MHSIAGDTLTLALEDSDATREMWGDHRFQVLYRITLGARYLTCKLQIVNRGSAPFLFQALLHTYYNLASLEGAKITGLDGVSFADKLQDGKVITQPAGGEGITFTEETDRIYFGDKVPTDVIISGLGDGKALRGSSGDGEQKDCLRPRTPARGFQFRQRAGEARTILWFEPVGGKRRW